MNQRDAAPNGTGRTGVRNSSEYTAISDDRAVKASERDERLRSEANDPRRTILAKTIVFASGKGDEYGRAGDEDERAMKTSGQRRQVIGHDRRRRQASARRSFDEGERVGTNGNDLRGRS